VERSAARAVDTYYRVLRWPYQLESNARGDQQFWAHLAARFAGGRVLELGAGQGRVTELLAATAAEVVALDISPAMLRVARHRLAAWPNVRLLLADMAVLALHQRFLLIVAANDPWSHLLDPALRRAALQRAAAHLVPGGHLVLDALWFNPTALAAKLPPAGEWSECVLATRQGRLHVRAHWRCQLDRQECEATYSYYWTSGWAAASFRARYWLATELSQELTQAGLVEVARWGDYHFTPWHPDRSPHLIVEAYRPP
jgi:SAM-dependent methyltransferase